MPLRAGISTVAVYRADPKNRGREMKRHLPWPMFVMADFWCGVPCRGSHGSAHNGVGSEKAAEHMSQHMALQAVSPQQAVAAAAQCPRVTCRMPPLSAMDAGLLRDDARAAPHAAGRRSRGARAETGRGDLRRRQRKDHARALAAGMAAAGRVAGGSGAVGVWAPRGPPPPRPAVRRAWGRGRSHEGVQLTRGAAHAGCRERQG